jgi:hypothetical protein
MPGGLLWWRRRFRLRFETFDFCHTLLGVGPGAGMRHGKRDQLRRGMHRELFANMTPVIAHRIYAQVQNCSNLFTGLTLANILEHFLFTGRESGV